MMKDLRHKTDRRAKDTQDLVGSLQSQIHKMQEDLTHQIDQLREPLATQLNHLRSENERLHTAFDQQKDDYRELTGGFLKVLESPREDIVKFRNDQFLNK